MDRDITGVFHTPYGDKTVEGFYDGGGRYCVRFMPEFEGAYTCEIRGSFSDQTYADSFVCTPARPDNHGPVRVRGECPERIRFLRQILSQTPGGYLKRWERGAWDEIVATCERADLQGRYMICYYGFNRHAGRLFRMPADRRYRVDVIDTWNMTIQDAGIHAGTFRIPLPGREYMAVRLTEVDG